MEVTVRDNNVDHALRTLKKKMQRECIYRDNSFGDFWNFLFKQALHKSWSRTAEYNFNAGSLRAYLTNQSSDPFTAMMRFTRNLFTTWKDCFDITELYSYHWPVNTVYGAIDDFVDQFLKLIDK